MCPEKEGEEDALVLKIVWIHKYDDSNTTLKRMKKRLVKAVSNNTDSIRTNRTRTKTKKQNWEEKNCIDISIDKLAKFHMRKPEHGYERKPQVRS